MAMDLPGDPPPVQVQAQFSVVHGIEVVVGDSALICIEGSTLPDGTRQALFRWKPPGCRSVSAMAAAATRIRAVLSASSPGMPTSIEAHDGGECFVARWPAAGAAAPAQPTVSGRSHELREGQEVAVGEAVLRCTRVSVDQTGLLSASFLWTQEGHSTAQQEAAPQRLRQFLLTRGMREPLTIHTMSGGIRFVALEETRAEDAKPPPAEPAIVPGPVVEPETVNHPQHYGGDTTYETIKVIEAWGLGFALGNAVKYISRAGRKGDAIEDLKKARFYLNREIENRITAAAKAAR